MRGRFFFCTNTENAVKHSFFCKNTENAVKINSPHRLSWQNNVRTAVKALKSVKKIHHILPHFLQKFIAKITAFLTKIHRI